MDPVSVTSSLLGILAVAGTISTCLSAFIASVKDAPLLATHIISEVDNLSLVLTRLQSVFVKHELQPRNSSKVTVKQLADILTGCAVTFLELERAIKGFGKSDDIGIMERIRWAMKEATVKALSDRLGVHKATIDLLLTVLLCDSSFETENSLREMKEQMRRLEATNRQLLDLLSLQINRTRLQAEENSETVSTMNFEFDSTLQSSHVYNRPSLPMDTPADSDSILESVLSRSTYDTAFSRFTGLSLAQVTNFSEIALPICNSDIPRGSEWFQVPEDESKTCRDSELFQAPDNETKICSGCQTSRKSTLKHRQPNLALLRLWKPYEMVALITSHSSVNKYDYHGEDDSDSYRVCTVLEQDHSLYYLMPGNSPLNDSSPQLHPWRFLCNMFILVYRLDKPESWTYVQKFVRKGCSRDPEQCPILIVSRVDLADVHNEPQNQTLLSYHQNWANGKQCDFATSDISALDHCSWVHEMLERVALRRRTELDRILLKGKGITRRLIPIGPPRKWNHIFMNEVDEGNTHETGPIDQPLELDMMDQDERQWYGTLKRLFKTPRSSRVRVLDLKLRFASSVALR